MGATKNEALTVRWSQCFRTRFSFTDSCFHLRDDEVFTSARGSKNSDSSDNKKGLMSRSAASRKIILLRKISFQTKHAFSHLKHTFSPIRLSSTPNGIWLSIAVNSRLAARVTRRISAAARATAALAARVTGLGPPFGGASARQRALRPHLPRE